MRVKIHRPNLWVIDDIETPDTIPNPKRMRKPTEHIETDVIATRIDKNRRLLYANNRFARVMMQTVLQECHPDCTVHRWL